MILSVTIKQGETILRPPYVLHKLFVEPVTIEVKVSDPQGLSDISRVQGAFEDPDFGSLEYQQKVTDYMGSFPGWWHTVGPINNPLVRDSYLPGEIYYGLGFDGELLDTGAGMEQNLPDEVAGDGIYTIRKNTRLDPRTKTNPTRPWRLYFWVTDKEAYNSEPFSVYVKIVD